ncbi:MAG: hypothetical protein JST30_15500 [Armatimonadetes bacterium]|nr:hypothetical protein [Armatimonadota bacterium]
MSVLIVSERGDEKPHQLRRDGIVPIGLIEKGKPTRKLQAPADDVRTSIGRASGIGLLELRVDGEARSRTVLVKHVDRLPHSPLILSMTLAAVAKDDEAVVDVPVHAVGTAGDVASGAGVLVHATPTIKVKGRLDQIPAQIDVDVSAVAYGHSIHASDLRLPEGLDLVTAGDVPVFSVHPVRAESSAVGGAAEDEEAGADVEPTES